MPLDLTGNQQTVSEFSNAHYQHGNVETSVQVMNEKCTGTTCELNADLTALSADFNRLRDEINALFPTNSTPDHVRMAVANGHRSVQNTVKTSHQLGWARCHRRNQPIQGLDQAACQVPAGDKTPASCYRA